MPRNGLGVAERLPSTTAVPNAVISSATSESVTNDIYNCLNSVPIHDIDKVTGLQDHIDDMAYDFDYRGYKVTSTGTATAIAVSYPINPASLLDGQPVTFVTNIAWGAAPNLVVGSLASKAVKKFKDGALVACEVGDVYTGQYVALVWRTAPDCYVLVSGTYPSEQSEVLLGGVAISGSTYTVNAATITKPYKRFVLLFFGVSHNQGTSQATRIEIMDQHTQAR
jgi:hypothetical protein